MKPQIPDNYKGPFAHKEFRPDGAIAKIIECYSYGKGLWRRMKGKVVYKDGKKVLNLDEPGARDELKKLLKER